METHAPKNKAMSAKEPLKQEFHFPGSGVYMPATILASSQEEAEKIWLETRQSVNKDEKVEKINKENNQ